MRIPVGEVARDAAIEVAIADPALAGRVASAIEIAVAAISVPPLAHPIVHLRSRRRLAERGAELTGAIAIVRVTRNNARHLVELIDGLRAAGAAGIQLVWDTTADPGAERHVFAALERARAAPAAAPVVVATTLDPVPVLRLLIAHRPRRT